MLVVDVNNLRLDKNERLDISCGGALKVVGAGIEENFICTSDLVIVGNTSVCNSEFGRKIVGRQTPRQKGFDESSIPQRSDYESLGSKLPGGNLTIRSARGRAVG
jgi:hypothetical protein